MEGKSSTPQILGSAAGGLIGGVAGKSLTPKAVPVTVVKEPKTKQDQINEIGGLASQLIQRAGNESAKSLNPQYANSQQSLFAPATVNFTPAQIAASQPRRPYA